MELVIFILCVSGLVFYYFFYKSKTGKNTEPVSPEHKNLFIRYFEEKGIDNKWIYHAYHVLHEYPGLDHKVIKPDSQLVKDLNLTLMDCRDLLIDINRPLNRRLPTMDNVQDSHDINPMLTVEDFIGFAYQYK